jgi:hypothetical protein
MRAWERGTFEFTHEVRQDLLAMIRESLAAIELGDDPLDVLAAFFDLKYIEYNVQNTRARWQR